MKSSSSLSSSRISRSSVAIAANLHFLFSLVQPPVMLTSHSRTAQETCHVDQRIFFDILILANVIVSKLSHSMRKSPQPWTTFACEPDVNSAGTSLAVQLLKTEVNYDEGSYRL